jgi:hypothetical protein
MIELDDEQRKKLQKIFASMKGKGDPAALIMAVLQVVNEYFNNKVFKEDIELLEGNAADFEKLQADIELNGGAPTAQTSIDMTIKGNSAGLIANKLKSDLSNFQHIEQVFKQILSKIDDDGVVFNRNMS